MARPLRIEYPGTLYHVMNRGNAGQDLFRTKRDRERFLECLDTAVERFSLKIHAYCLMTTHIHLLVETMDANLSRAVQWIMGKGSSIKGRVKRKTLSCHCIC